MLDYEVFEITPRVDGKEMKLKRLLKEEEWDYEEKGGMLLILSLYRSTRRGLRDASLDSPSIDQQLPKRRRKGT